MSRIRRALKLVVCALIATVAIAVAIHLHGSAPRLPKVTLATATRGDIEVGVLATGTIEAAKLVSIGAQATGELKHLRVRLGDQVKKGDLIAEVDSLVQQNALRTATAALANVIAQRQSKLATLQLSELTRARLKALNEVDARSQEDLETAEANLVAAKADVGALDAQISEAKVAEDAAKVNLGYARIVAPMDGTVVAVVTEQGQTINTAQSVPTIIKLARLDSMTIKAQVSEADVSRVRPGLPVHFSLLGEPSTRYDTTLRFVEPGPTTLATDSSNPTNSSTATAIYYNALFDVPNHDGKLRISMTAQATIVVAQAHDVLLIPSAALRARDSSGRYLIRILKESTLAERWVHIGLNNRIQAQVLDGLSAGDQVVTSEAAPDGGSTALPLRGNQRGGF